MAMYHNVHSIMIRAEDEKAFLDILADGGTVGKAARHTGISRPTWYRKRDADEDFAAAWDEAAAHGRLSRLDRVEDALLESATEGRPDQYLNRNGEVVTLRRRDTIAGIVLAKRLDPLYRDNPPPPEPPQTVAHPVQLTLSREALLFLQQAAFTPLLGAPAPLTVDAVAREAHPDTNVPPAAPDQ